MTREQYLEAALKEVLPYAEGMLRTLLIAEHDPEVSLLADRVRNAQRLLDI